MTTTRRSIYALNDQLPLSPLALSEVIEEVVLNTPSAFNSQSSRLVVLLGPEHQKFWALVENALRKVVPPENFDTTAVKLDGFRAGAGTVLFFEDELVIRELQERVPLYAASFPLYAEQTNAMHQYALWTALADNDIGANLQHYNPLVDAEVQKLWQLPSTWTLKAQLVFGGIKAPAGEKEFKPLNERLKFFGL